MTDPNRDDTEGAPPRSVRIEGDEKKGSSWLPWLLLALGVLALLFALSRCHRDEKAVVTNQTVTETTTTNDMSNDTTGAAGNVVGSTSTVSPTTAAGVSGLGTYLKGSDAAPRNFNFEKLNFDTGKSVVRAADRSEVDQVAGVLKQYSNTHVRIVGYADARGTAPANKQLGQARADAVKAALVGGGIAADRIETASGGEEQPIDSNANTGGRAENRRTELVVTQR